MLNSCDFGVNDDECCVCVCAFAFSEIGWAGGASRNTARWQPSQPQEAHFINKPKWDVYLLPLFVAITHHYHRIRLFYERLHDYPKLNFYIYLITFCRSFLHYFTTIIVIRWPFVAYCSMLGCIAADFPFYIVYSIYCIINDDRQPDFTMPGAFLH